MRTCASRNLPRGGGWQEGFEDSVLRGEVC